MFSARMLPPRTSIAQFVAARLAEPKTWSRRTKAIVAVKGILVVGTATVVTFFWPEIRFTARACFRSARTLYAAAAIAIDYQSSIKYFDKSSDNTAALSAINSKNGNGLLLPAHSQTDPAEALLLQKETTKRQSASSRHSIPKQDSLDERDEREKSKVHQRAANRLLHLFRKNGGVYIKIGQHLAALEYILPAEYCSTMAVLHNQAPTSSLGDVERVFREELGASGQKLSDIFEYFEETPIGAASLAQVHYARLRETGEDVAVKVQHHDLQAYAEVDMHTVSLAVKLIKRLFPDFEFDWLAEEMRINLPRELDFVQEALNAERVAHNFFAGSSNRVHLKIPRIHWSLTRKRILVMEYCPGAKITDVAFMKQNGIDTRQVSAQLTRIFSEMIFLHGFVHCDPHPGNIHIRMRNRSADQQNLSVSGCTQRHQKDHPAAPVLSSSNNDPRHAGATVNQPLPAPVKAPLFDGVLGCVRGMVASFWHDCGPDWELVLLDHGLYRELTDEFRQSYARLWKALIDGDEKAIKKHSEDLGGGNTYRLFSCILTQRSWNSITLGSMDRPTTKLEMIAVKAKATQYFRQVAKLLASLPRSLLLLLKTNDLLRSVERCLHAGDSRPSMTFMIMAHYCIDAIYLDECNEGIFSRRARLRAILRMLFAHAKITLAEWALQVYYYMYRKGAAVTPEHPPLILKNV